MRCPACAQQLRVMSTITDLGVVKEILDYLHVRSKPLPRAPARDPTWEQQVFEYDAAE